MRATHRVAPRGSVDARPVPARVHHAGAGLPRPAGLDGPSAWGYVPARNIAAGAPRVRLAGEARYAAESWDAERRVIYKAEALVKGPNTRFVVTTRTSLQWQRSGI